MKIVIIGAGNIATHYAKIFYGLDHEISQIYNRTSANAKVLADAVSAHVVDEIEQVTTEADLYIIATADYSILKIVEQLSANLNGIIIHTSGATPLSVLSKFKNYGVIYPPQSLNKEVETPYRQIPFAVEGSDTDIESILLQLAQTISPKAFLCNSQQRLAIHVAAVFANNFTNTLFDIAYSILNNEDIDFEIIKPIILTTAQKVQNKLPHEVQTGPAVRNDKKTINSHLQFLSYSNDLSQIYQLLTDFIIKSRLK